MRKSSLAKFEMFHLDFLHPRCFCCLEALTGLCSRSLVLGLVFINSEKSFAMQRNRVLLLPLHLSQANRGLVLSLDIQIVTFSFVFRVRSDLLRWLYLKITFQKPEKVNAIRLVGLYLGPYLPPSRYISIQLFSDLCSCQKYVYAFVHKSACCSIFGGDLSRKDCP